jgi:hypothetical protein
VRLIHVEAATTTSAKHKDRCSTGGAISGAGAAGTSKSTTASTVALSAVTVFLNAILNLVRIQAEVLCLSHRAADRDRLGRTLSACAIQGQIYILRSARVIAWRRWTLGSRRIRACNRKTLEAATCDCRCGLLNDGGTRLLLLCREYLRPRREHEIGIGSLFRSGRIRDNFLRGRRECG